MDLGEDSVAGLSNIEVQSLEELSARLAGILKEVHSNAAVVGNIISTVDELLQR